MSRLQNINLKIKLATAFQQYEKGLKTYARFRIADPVVCDELVQDTFVKTWKYLVREGNIDLMKPFLYHILNYLIIDEYRKRKNISLDQLVEKGYEFHDSEIEKHINELDGAALALLITTLPPPYALILKMRYVQHMTLQEMSVKTGSTKNTMAVQVHRGLAKLRTMYHYEAM